MKFAELRNLFFYPKGYLLLNPDVAQSGISPLRHFLQYGLKEGRTNGFPVGHKRCFRLKGRQTLHLQGLDLSPLYYFDSSYYLQHNLDVKRSKFDAWTHYVEHGIREKRRSYSFFYFEYFLFKLSAGSGRAVSLLEINGLFTRELDSLDIEERNLIKDAILGSDYFFNPENLSLTRRPYKLVVAHELSRTGCPINALNLAVGIQKTDPIIFISFGEGPLKDSVVSLCNFVIILPDSFKRDERRLALLLRLLNKFITIDAGILNSICSYPFGLACKTIGAKGLLFIHEFPYYLPKTFLEDFQKYSDLIIFSNKTIYKAFESVVPIKKPSVVFNQGKSTAPEELQSLESGTNNDVAPVSSESKVFEELEKTKKGSNFKIILGVGSVEYRKGLDLFISVAFALKEQHPDIKCKFVWLGEFNNSRQPNYKQMLLNQISFMNLNDDIMFLGSVKNVDKFYELSDILLLTSRLDPLPGCVIEALSKSLPCILFDKASGFPELFHENGLEFCVVPYLDTCSMAETAHKLLSEDVTRKNIIRRGLSLIDSRFSMKEYVKKVKYLLTMDNYSNFKEGGGELKFPASLKYLNNDSNTPFFLSPMLFGLKELNSNDLRLNSEEIDVLVGGNTGNMAYHDAIKHITGIKQVSGNWSDIPISDSHSLKSIGIYPCANQIGPHADMGEAADCLEKTEMPFVAFGLGSQIEFDEKGDLNRQQFSVPIGTRRWLRELCLRAPGSSPNIAVRGESSLEVLDELGFGNSCEVLGCPTLFLNTQERELGKKLVERNAQKDRICVALGHYSWDKVKNLESHFLSLIKNSTNSSPDLLVQSNINMIRLAKGDFEDISPEIRKKIFMHFSQSNEGGTETEVLRELHRRSTFFLDSRSWMDFYKGFDFVIGPRIHGVMLALQAGVPALCVTIDARTEELCKTMMVPHIKFNEFPKNLTKNDLDLVELVGFDSQVFDQNRDVLAKRTMSFMFKNRIRPSQEFLEFCLGN